MVYKLCKGRYWLLNQFTECALCNSNLTLTTFLTFIFMSFLLQIQNFMLTTPLFCSNLPFFWRNIGCCLWARFVTFCFDLFSVSAFLCLHFQKWVFVCVLTLMIKKWQYDTWASFSWSKRAKYILVVTAYFKSPFSLSVELSVIIGVENDFESSIWDGGWWCSGRRGEGALVPQHGKRIGSQETCIFKTSFIQCLQSSTKCPTT